MVVVVVAVNPQWNVGSCFRAKADGRKRFRSIQQ